MRLSRLFPRRPWFGSVHPVRRLRRATLGLTQLVFPACCAGCDGELPDAAPAWALCDTCRARLAPSDALRCGRCGAIAAHAAGDATGCDDCRPRSLGFDRVWVWGDYVGEIRAAVLRMKHAREEPLSAAIGHLLADRLCEPLAAWQADVVTCVPMHWSRRWARGTNSAEILAEIIAGRLRLPLAGRVVSRRRRTQPQAGLAPSERFNNVRGAFRVRSGVSFGDARVLLLDDVLTTGATCGEIARLFKRAGAKQVAVLVVACAPRPD
ncbi:MAG TPA: ComF family protein [Pirellulales bacterium]|nr:ComF family protein [Pirellulales bacterium]